MFVVDSRYTSWCCQVPPEYATERGNHPSNALRGLDGSEGARKDVLMVAHAVVFADVDTGKRPVSAGAREAFRCATSGGRLVQTKRGFALFDEEGRFVGMIQAPATKTKFGRVAPTMLLNR